MAFRLVVVCLVPQSESMTLSLKVQEAVNPLEETMVDTIRILAFRLDLFRQFGRPNSDLYLRLFEGADLDRNGRAPESALRTALQKCLGEPLTLEATSKEH
jgi:hypothetical protein